MTKGNEKDCICANNGKHTKNCDAYRLSQFLLQMAAVALDEPDSPEEKKCCDYCKDLEFPSAHMLCSCHGKPETTHEKDFIEEAVEDFRRRMDNGEFKNPITDELSMSPWYLETFLKEKLTSARESCKDKSGMYHLGHKEGYDAGRLAMKEKVVSSLDRAIADIHKFQIGSRERQAERIKAFQDVLAAIREMK